MLYRLTDSMLIVDPYVGDSRDIGPDINEDQWNLTEPKVLDQRFFHTKRQDRHTIHPAFDHAPDRRFHPFWVMHGGGHQDLVVVLDRKIFERLHNFREERVGDLRDDQTKETTPS